MANLYSNLYTVIYHRNNNKTTLYWSFPSSLHAQISKTKYKRITLTTSPTTGDLPIGCSTRDSLLKSILFDGTKKVVPTVIVLFVFWHSQIVSVFVLDVETWIEREKMHFFSGYYFSSNFASSDCMSCMYSDLGQYLTSTLSFIISVVRDFESNTKI